MWYLRKKINEIDDSNKLQQLDDSILRMQNKLKRHEVDLWLHLYNTRALIKDRTQEIIDKWWLQWIS